MQKYQTPLGYLSKEQLQKILPLKPFYWCKESKTWRLTSNEISWQSKDEKGNTKLRTGNKTVAFDILEEELKALIENSGVEDIVEFSDQFVDQLVSIAAPKIRSYILENEVVK